MTDILDTAREELAKGNGAESCPICYSIIRALVAEVEQLRQRHAEAVEGAYKEAADYYRSRELYDPEGWQKRIHAAWLASEAKARLT